jgi:hypothetical protein
MLLFRRIYPALKVRDRHFIKCLSLTGAGYGSRTLFKFAKPIDFTILFETRLYFHL